MPRRRTAAVAALAALALCAPATARADDCAGADAVPAADNVAAVNQATLCLLNEQRAAQGVAPLAENAELSSASAGYSQQMVAQGFFAHQSPDGGTLVDRLTGAGYLGDDEPWLVGENIGWGQGGLATPRSMVSAWMDSPGHRENLLSADYTEVGLGLALGTPVDQSWGATYTTDFGAGARATAADAMPRARKSAPRRKAARVAACVRAADKDRSGRAAAKGRSGQATTKGRSGRSAKRRASTACSRTSRVRRR
jgi:uncharacterized protein YkwD